MQHSRRVCLHRMKCIRAKKPSEILPKLVSQRGSQRKEQLPCSWFDSQRESLLGSLRPNSCRVGQQSLPSPFNHEQMCSHFKNFTDHQSQQLIRDHGMAEVGRDLPMLKQRQLQQTDKKINMKPFYTSIKRNRTNNIHYSYSKCNVNM